MTEDKREKKLNYALERAKYLKMIINVYEKEIISARCKKDKIFERGLKSRIKQAETEIKNVIKSIWKHGKALKFTQDEIKLTIKEIRG